MKSLYKPKYQISPKAHAQGPENLVLFTFYKLSDGTSRCMKLADEVKYQLPSEAQEGPRKTLTKLGRGGYTRQQGMETSLLAT